MFATKLTLTVTLVVVFALLGAQCEQLSSQSDGINSLDDERHEAAANMLARHNSRLLAVPNSLARFLYYNARAHQQAAIDRQQQQQQQLHETSSSQLTQLPSGGNGNKRSSSSLDALTGMTLGKRSIQSTNQNSFVNNQLDSVPLFGRQQQQQQQQSAYGLRSPARLYWSSSSYEPTSHRFEDLY